LLNTALTVLKGSPESHLDLWNNFMKMVFKKLSEREFTIWVILGKKSSEWKEYITNDNHIILETSHPSPFSAHNNSNNNAFIGSNLFKNINKELYKKGIDNISW